GNLREEPFKKIYERHKERLLWIRLRKRENLEGFCSSCEHNSVCWGCRSSAYYYTGDDFAADPKCWLNPENLK
ncbi:MAG: radical SAM protein, partial [Candidatus Methanofastidiosia archaeon]